MQTFERGKDVVWRAAERLQRSRKPLPPGPPFPAAVNSAWWLARPIELMNQCVARYGPTFTLRILRQGDVVFLSEPAAIREVFTGSPDDLYAGEAAQVLEPLLGKSSLLLLDGERHARERRLVMPAFHGERVEAYGRTMREIAERCFADAPHGEPHPIFETMQAITLDVILRTVFGMEDASRLTQLRSALIDVVKGASDPLKLLPWPDIAYGQFSPWSGFFERVYEVDSMLAEEIDKRRRNPGAGHDVLSILVAARDDEGRAMTDYELRDEMMTMLLAGHETTATALAWACHLLLENPDVLEALVRDLDAVGDAEPKKVAAVPLLDAVVKETLRLKPVVPLVGRRLKRDMRIAGYDLPLGVFVAPCVYLAQRNPDIYPDPERFNPKRFLDAKPNPYAFLPFGGGARRCVGMAFAMLEAKLVLAALLRSYRLEKVAGREVRAVRRAVTLAPSGGMTLVMWKR